MDRSDLSQRRRERERLPNGFFCGPRRLPTNAIVQAPKLRSIPDTSRRPFSTGFTAASAAAGNNSGQSMAGMEERSVQFYAPVESAQPQAGNPALRDDPRVPVPSTDRAGLPRNPRGQLDKSCFVYDALHDQYYCPPGQAMPYDHTNQVMRSRRT